MKRLYPIIFVLCLFTTQIEGQTIFQDEVSSDASSISADYKYLKSSLPLRLTEGIARILPDFQGDGWDDDTKGAVEYACKLMEERILSALPIKIKMIRDSNQPVSYVKTFVNTSPDYGGNPNVHQTNFEYIGYDANYYGYKFPLATAKRWGVLNSQSGLYNSQSHPIFTHHDGEIYFSPSAIFSTTLDGTVGSDKYDLVSVTLREVGKILGMTTSGIARDNSNGGLKAYTLDNGVKYFLPYLFVQFRWKNVDMTNTISPYQYSVSGNGGIGWNEIPEYGIYCPSSFKLNTSLAYFKEDANNIDTKLFQPELPKGTAIHHIGTPFLDVLKCAFWEMTDTYPTGTGDDGPSVDYITDTNVKDPTQTLSFSYNSSSLTSQTRVANINETNRNTELIPEEGITVRRVKKNRSSSLNLSLNNYNAITKSAANSSSEDGFSHYYNDGIIEDHIQEFLRGQAFNELGWHLYLLKKDGSLDEVASQDNPWASFSVNIRSLGLNLDDYARTTDGYLRARLNFNGTDYSGSYHGPTNSFVYNYAMYFVINEAPPTPILSIKSNDLVSSNDSEYYKDVQVAYSNMEGVNSGTAIIKEYDGGDLISSVSVPVDVLKGQHLLSVDRELTTTVQLNTSNSLGEKSSNIINISPDPYYTLRATFIDSENIELVLLDKNSNPANKEINTVKVLSSSGNLQSYNLHGGTGCIRMSGLPKGVYHISARDDRGKLYIAKVLKR